MVQVPNILRALIRCVADCRAISVSYASMLLTGSGDTVKRMVRGA